ncbi:MAG: site-2 protease family protein [Thermomicrobiales bacterium]
MQPQFDPNKVYETDYRVSGDGEVVRTDKRPSWLKSRFGPVGVAIIFALTKLKWILALFKFKFLATGLTALLSVGAYALLFPWQFAVGLVVLIFIHEIGHVIVLRRYGVAATAPVFIPFMGAFIGMKQLPKNATMEAYVGLGGPVIGSLGAFAAYAVYLATDYSLWLVLAYIGIILNLFNLLPIMPLDGGRITGAISRWIWVAGYVLAVGLMFVRPSPILMIVLIFGAGETWNAIRGRGETGYYTVPASERLTIALIYFGLMAILGFTLFELEPLMEANRP